VALGLSHPLPEMSVLNLPLAKRCRRVRLTNCPSFTSRLSWKFWSLDVSRPCVPTRPVTMIALHLLIHRTYMYICVYTILSCASKARNEWCLTRWLAMCSCTPIFDDPWHDLAPLSLLLYYVCFAGSSQNQSTNVGLYFMSKCFASRISEWIGPRNFH
jgi:hypothetical protein